MADTSATSDHSEPNGSPLSPKEQAAVLALLTSPTIAAAARKVNVGERTLRRWLKQEPFRAALWEARQELMWQVTAQLQQASSSAVEALVRNLTCGRPGDEIRAAIAVIEHAENVGELTNLVDELRALLQKMNQPGG